MDKFHGSGRDSRPTELVQGSSKLLVGAAWDGCVKYVIQRWTAGSLMGLKTQGGIDQTRSVQLPQVSVGRYSGRSLRI